MPADPIDPHAIMSRHHSDGEDRCNECEPFSLVPWPCEPYRLAEALAAEQAKVAGYVEVAMKWQSRAVALGWKAAALADQPEQDR